MRLAVLILCISAAILGYEIALMRALSVARWHHFAYMIVSVAMLGFGASGTLLSLWGKRLLKRFDASITAFAVAFTASIPLTAIASQWVPFDVFQLAWDWHQYLYLFEYYLLLVVPFLLGATCIGLALMRETERAHGIYFWNLLGSGLGSCGMVALMFVLPPAELPLGAFAVAAIGALAFCLPLARRAPYASVVAVLVAAPVAVTLWRPFELRISEHKQLRVLLDLGDTQVVETRTGPLGLIHVLDGPMIREIKGRSVGYVGGEPRQRAILFDADSASPILHITAPGQVEGLDWTPNALPYHLLDRPSTLVIGAGGGSDVLLARYHRCRSITALELNPKVVDLVTGSQAGFAQHLYQQPEVELICAEARGYLARTDRKFDLIQLPLVDSLGSTSAGAAALGESYLYTVEAFDAYLDRLTPNGILSITRWLRMPPSDVPRILTTLTEALHRRGLDDASLHVIAIRGMFTATILASPAPFSATQLEAVRPFCQQRDFDVIWHVVVKRFRGEEGPTLFPMPSDEANFRNELPEPYYYLAARMLVAAAPERELFIESYPVDISPTTDDRPYHSLSFGLRALRHVRETMGDDWVRYVDWGYLVLLATLVQAIVAAIVLILLPLLFLRREAGARGGRLATCAYFACLGAAYMFTEIIMMQKLSLFLASPIYSAAVVLTSFMVFSGLGSLSAGRLLDGGRRAAGLGLLGILVVGLAMWAGLDGVLRPLAGSAAWLRFTVAALAAGLLAFFMGMPFPSGLRCVATRSPALTPWAWGVNGSASVVGATLAMVLAVSLGFRTVLLLALALYTLAALTLPRIQKQTGGNLS